MRIVVDSADLRKAVETVLPVIPKKTDFPALAGIMMKSLVSDTYFEEDEPTKKLELVATDLETELGYRIDVVEADGEGKFVIDGKLINEITKNLPAGEVELEYEKGVLKIKSGKSKFKLNTLPVEDFPDLTELKETTSLELPCQTIKNMMEKVIFCASSDDYMINMKGIFWEFTGDSLKLVATDGIRLGLVEEKIQPVETKYSLLLPLKSMKSLLKILPDCTGNFFLSFNDVDVGFLFEEAIIITRIIDADFPDYSRVIPSFIKTEVLVNKTAFKEAVKRASIPAKVGHEGITIEIKDNVIAITSRTPDYAEVYEEVEAEKSGQDITVSFNPKFLLDALQRIETTNVKLQLEETYKPLVITQEDDDSLMYLVMPLR